MKTHDIIIWIGLIIGGLFVYGKYFVAVTELEKMNYGLMAMLFILFALIIRISSDVRDIKQKIGYTGD